MQLEQNVGVSLFKFFCFNLIFLVKGACECFLIVSRPLIHTTKPLQTNLFRTHNRFRVFVLFQNE